MQETEILYGSGELPKSRSQKKRESSARQNLGEQLTALPPQRLAKLNLPPELQAAMATWRSNKKNNEASRRQMQYIGRLMRELDEETVSAIEAALADGIR